VIAIVLIVASLAACGESSDDSKLLTASSAAELRTTLAEVQQNVENGDCTGAQQQVALLDQQVTSLAGVDANLRDALTSGVSRLQQLVSTECEAPVDTGTTDSAGTTDSGGAAAPDEEQTDESGKDKNKEKKKDEQGQDEATGDEGQSDTGGESGSGDGSSGGTTGTGGVVP
jgi:hypothetical protein